MTADAVREVDLALGERLGGGGQANVYALDQPGTVFKRYHNQQINAPALRSLLRWRAERSAAELADLGRWTAWPHTIVVGPNGKPTGFLMNRAPQRFVASLPRGPKLRELQFLLYPAKRAWAGVGTASLQQRIGLCVDLAELLDFLHARGMVVGDISAANILWTLRPMPQVFLIDADGCRRSGSHPVTPQLDTPGWQDPIQTGPATVVTDRYKLALAVVRLLAGSPSVRPADSGCLPLSVPNDLRQALFPLVQAAVPPTARPSAADWASALSRHRRAASATTKTRKTIKVGTSQRAKPPSAAPRKTIKVRRPPGS